MSFETTTKFLSEAALYGDYDSLRSPSACIAMGRPIRYPLARARRSGCSFKLTSLQLLLSSLTCDA
jgi:hypothetical protein